MSYYRHQSTKGPSTLTAKLAQLASLQQSSLNSIHDEHAKTLDWIDGFFSQLEANNNKASVSTANLLKTPARKHRTTQHPLSHSKLNSASKDSLPALLFSTAPGSTAKLNSKNKENPTLALGPAAVIQQRVAVQVPNDLATAEIERSARMILSPKVVSQRSASVDDLFGGGVPASAGAGIGGKKVEKKVKQDIFMDVDSVATSSTVAHTTAAAAPTAVIEPVEDEEMLEAEPEEEEAPVEKSQEPEEEKANLSMIGEEEEEEDEQVTEIDVVMKPSSAPSSPFKPSTTSKSPLSPSQQPILPPLDFVVAAPTPTSTAQSPRRPAIPLQQTSSSLMVVEDSQPISTTSSLISIPSFAPFSLDVEEEPESLATTVEVDEPSQPQTLSSVEEVDEPSSSLISTVQKVEKRMEEPVAMEEDEEVIIPETLPKSQHADVKSHSKSSTSSSEASFHHEADSDIEVEPSTAPTSAPVVAAAALPPPIPLPLEQTLHTDTTTVESSVPLNDKPSSLRNTNYRLSQSSSFISTTTPSRTPHSLQFSPKSSTTPGFGLGGTRRVTGGANGKLNFVGLPKKSLGFGILGPNGSGNSSWVAETSTSTSQSQAGETSAIGGSLLGKRKSLDPPAMPNKLQRQNTEEDVVRPRVDGVTGEKERLKALTDKLGRLNSRTSAAAGMALGGAGQRSLRDSVAFDGISTAPTTTQHQSTATTFNNNAFSSNATTSTVNSGRPLSPPPLPVPSASHHLTKTASSTALGIPSLGVAGGMGSPPPRSTAKEASSSLYPALPLSPSSSKPTSTSATPFSPPKITCLPSIVSSSNAPLSPPASKSTFASNIGSPKSGMSRTVTVSNLVSRFEQKVLETTSTGSASPSKVPTSPISKGKSGLRSPTPTSTTSFAQSQSMQLSPQKWQSPRLQQQQPQSPQRELRSPLSLAGAGGSGLRSPLTRSRTIALGLSNGASSSNGANNGSRSPVGSAAEREEREEAERRRGMRENTPPVVLRDGKREAFGSTTPKDTPPPVMAMSKEVVEIEEVEILAEQRVVKVNVEEMEVDEEDHQREESESDNDGDRSSGEEEDASDSDDDDTEIRQVGDMLGVSEESLRFGDDDEETLSSRRSSSSFALVDGFGAKLKERELPSLPRISLEMLVEDEEESIAVVVEKGRGGFATAFDGFVAGGGEDPLRKTVRPSNSSAGSLNALNDHSQLQSQPTAQPGGSKTVMPGTFGADSDAEGEYEEEGELGEDVTTFTNASTSGRTISRNQSSVGGSSFLSKSAGATGKNTMMVKSIKMAQAAKEKEQLEKERRAALKEEREQKRLLVLQKKQEEERSKLDEEKRLAEKKRKEREEAALKNLGVAGGVPKAGTQARNFLKPKQDEDPLRKRKLDAESSSQPPSRPPSQLGAAPGAKKPTGPPASSSARPYQPSNLGSSLNSSIGRSGSTNNLSHSLKSSQPQPQVASTSSMVGVKFINVPGGNHHAGGPFSSAPPTRVPANKPVVQQQQKIVHQQQQQQIRIVASSSSQHYQAPQPKSEPEEVLPDIDSEYSNSEDEEHQQKMREYPHWVQSPITALSRQAHVNPDELFGTMKPLSMKEIFRNNASLARVSKRSSSARWEGTDALTEEEISSYSKRMGYK